jgi:hypothetical protein
MACSIDDYSTTYLDDLNKAWMHPLTPAGKVLPLLINVPKSGTPVGHLKVFFRYLLMIVQETTILHPEFTDYFENMQETDFENE